ncbi:unnamed protein product [Blepharisma stoltei]|uniref:LNR domain-containing protein n=1 Tax=Blepharisma stoltei TaxID=1481888 RepID=A0AAU9JDC2_9CILI|nr:unnamed protein product [Blepharisma stoltei]
MNQGCNFDGGDCEYYCTYTLGCTLKSNGVCDSSCDLAYCGYDHGDCGYCSDGCSLEFLQDTACHQECSNSLCNFNNYECECNPGCQYSMLGNGVCDWTCMNYYCQYDGGDCWDSSCSSGCTGYLLTNYYCDPECNTPSCFYDNGDCLCAAGCYPDLLENGICDPVCSTAPCNFDNYLCGDCATDCFNDMINNGFCDSECYNEGCGYDGNDCPTCASGCFNSDLGLCKPECLVLDCDFDLNCIEPNIIQSSFYAQIAAHDWNYPVNTPNSCYAKHGCSLNYNNFDWHCQDACSNADCFFDYFQCWSYSCYDLNNCGFCATSNSKMCGYCLNKQFYNYCVDNCPRYYTPYYYYKMDVVICAPVLDGSTEEIPDESFISANDVEQGDGSIDSPYNSLSYGLSQLAWKYSVVYLMRGIHNLTQVIDDDYLLEATASRPLYRTSNKLVQITIKPLYCSIYSHPDCVNDDESITIIVDTLPIAIDILTNVTFENIIFDGSTKFSPFCTDCDYCKATTSDDGVITDDHGNTLDSNSYVPQSTCDEFHNTNFFEIGSNGILYLNNVEINNFRQQYNSIVTLKGGILDMSLVSFYNIMSKPNSGVIVSNACSSDYCGELHFINSSVSLLNNGYEVNDAVDLAGFMVLNQIKYVKFEDITIEYNLVNSIDPESSTKAMFTFNEILNLTVLNSVFQYNFNYDALFFINQYKLDMPLEIDDNKKLVYENLINIWIENALFQNNSAITSSTFIIQFNRDLQNILINNCTFLNNYSEDDGIIDISYKGKLIQEYISGDSRVTTLDSGQKIKADFPAKSITLKNLNFTKNTFGGSGISLSNLPNLYILNSTWNGNGDNLNEDANTVTINYMKSLGYLYINSSVVSALPSCKSVISTTSINNFIFHCNTISQNYCTQNNAGLALTNCLNQTILRNSVFSDNKSSGNSIALAATMSSALVLKNLTFKNNYFYNGVGSSVVTLSSSTSASNFTLINCNFIGGETPISASSVQIFAWENSIVESLSSSFYSALVFSGRDGIKSKILLKNCTIKNNNPKLGHISISSLASQSYVLLTMSNMTFSNNGGGQNIIFIDKSVNLDSPSQISYSNFTNNKMTSVYARHLSGTLLVFSCVFDSNSASYAVVLNLDHSVPAETHLSESSITSNRGSNILYINGNTAISQLTTLNLYVFNNTGNAVFIAKGHWTDQYSNFYQNSASQGGSAIIKDESVVNLEGAVFKNNSATSDGGAIYISGASNITCNNCTIVKNTSKHNGGGLAVDQSSIFIFNNSVFSENKCDMRGSAISILGSESSYSYLINTEISYNIAGSMAAISSDSGLFSLQSCSVFNNTGATNSGIFMIYSTCNISDSSFSNHTGTSGSDLYINIDSSLFVYNTNFKNSISTSSGGSISVADSSLSCEKCNFLNAKAPTGAVLQCTSGSRCKLISSSILSSSASSTGGVIYIYDSTLSANKTTFKEYISSAIEASKSKLIEILDSEFKSGINDNGAALNCIDCINVTIIGTEFKNLISSAGGAIKFDHTTVTASNFIANIENSIFENCASLYGGSIYSNNINIGIKNSIFRNNSATNLESNSSCTDGEGGALYLTSTVQISVSIKNSDFIDNSACLSGGAVQWYLSQPTISNLSFSNNSALYGDDLASFPLSLLVLSYKRRLEVQVPSAPGQYLSSPLIVGITDHYNQTVLTENTSTCQLEVTDSSNYSLSGKTKVQASSGVYNFSEVIVSGEPGSKVGFTLSSSIISSDSLGLSSESLEFELRDCEVGEALLAKTCQVCDSGTYNLNAGDSCKDCPTSAKCYGKNNIYPKAGYWRVSNLTDNFLACPNSHACLGGIDSNNSVGTCKKGYQGNLCQSCEEGYSRNGEDTCSKCPNPVTNSLILVGMITLALFIVLIMTRSSIKSAYKPKSLTSVYIKIFMNYLQLVVVTASFNLNWPQLVLQVFSIQNTAGSMTDQIFSVDCYLQGQKSKPFFSKLIFMAVLPMILAFLTMMFWVGYYLFVLETKYLKNKFLGSLVVQLFLIQPSLVKYNFSNFNCMEIESGSYYLRSDLDIKCWDAEHITYSLTVALPSIIIWCIAVPTLCLWSIHKHREQLNTIELKLQFGFLYLGFKDKTYYWEFTILYRKILIICCAVFLGSTSTRIQALTVFFLLLFCFFLHRKIEPYCTNQLNSLETKSILVSGLTIYSGLYYLTDDLIYPARILLFIIIVSANLFFLAHWISSMTGVGISILYSKIKFLRRMMHGTRIEKWIQSISPINISDQETDFDKNSITKEIQNISMNSIITYNTEEGDSPGLKNWKRLKFSEITQSPEVSVFEIKTNNVEYDHNHEKDSISILKEADDTSIFEKVPYPTLREVDNEAKE